MLSAALLAFLPPFAAPQEWTASGLHEGEAVSSCALALPSEELRSTRFRGFRVLDGLSGEPLADVRAELWKEEDSRVRCVDRARTARDGVCLLDPLNGASKLILRKEGYASEELGTGGEQIVFLFPERPLLGRVLDFQGRPIFGARLATRQSCKHAPHAATATTDARGQFRMFDFPNGPNGASIEITAPGFAAVSLEDETRWWTEIEATGEVVFFLARQSELHAQLLTQEGEAYVGVTFENYERPLTFSVTDGEGHLAFPSWSEKRRLWCTSSDGTHYEFPDVPLPRTIPTILREGTPDVPEPDSACLVNVQPTLHGGFFYGISFDDLEDDVLPSVSIFTPSGETYSGVGPHFLDQAHGSATIVVGESFSGWREAAFEFDLEGPLQRPDIRIERETEIKLTLPNPDEIVYEGVRVEVDGVSKVIDPENPEEGGLSIPQGSATFLLELENGEVRCLQLENKGDEPMLLVDLTKGGEILREAWWTDRTVLAEMSREPDLSYQALEISIDENLPQVAHVHCSGLDFSNRDRRVRINALPGPLDVVLEFEDGSAAALTLHIRAGEERTITLR